MKLKILEVKQRPNEFVVVKANADESQYTPVSLADCRLFKTIDIEPTSHTIGFNSAEVIQQINQVGYAVVKPKIVCTERG